jgi:hypothetical protein
LKNGLLSTPFKYGLGFGASAAGPSFLSLSAFFGILKREAASAGLEPPKSEDFSGADSDYFSSGFFALPKSVLPSFLSLLKSEPPSFLSLPKGETPSGFLAFPNRDDAPPSDLSPK